MCQNTEIWKKLKEQSSDEKRNGIDGEEEMAPLDWRVRAGP